MGQARRSSRTRAERPRQRAQAGFTLLEVEAAVVVLSLLILGFGKLVWHYEELAAEGDRWCQGSQSVFVKIADDEIERILGMPATVVSSEPADPPGPPPPDAYEVEVLSTTDSLYPRTASASVLMTENP